MDYTHATEASIHSMRPSLSSQHQLTQEATPIMSNHFTSTKIDSRQVRRDPAKLRGMGLLNAEVSGMSPPASRSMMSTVLGPALLLAMAGLAGCGGGSDDSTASAFLEKQALCEPSPRDAAHYEHVCLKLADLFDTAKITAAKKAYAEHAVVVLEGGTMGQLRTALGLSDDTQGDPEALQLHKPESLPALSSDDPAESIASLSTDIVGIQVRPDGTENEFVYLRNPTLAFFNDRLAEDTALEDWENSVDEIGQTKSVTPKEAPSLGGGWSQQANRITRVASDAGSLTSITSTYRLNGQDTAFDYYMVTNRMIGSANNVICKSPLIGEGAIGYYTYLRETFIDDVSFGTTERTRVFETGPSTSVGSSTQGFSIGGSLGASPSGPTAGVSATYSESYSSTNVSTDRVAMPAPTLVGWKYGFTSGRKFAPKVCPLTSTYNSLTLPNAIIVQRPKGFGWDVQVFNRNNFVYETFKDAGSRHNFNPSNIWTSERFSLRQPQFSVNTNNLNIPAVTRTATLGINAVVPGSQFPLNWRITNIPLWLAVNQTSGSGPKDITLTAQPGTPAGSIAYLNVDTFPANAANSVERGPLVVQVMVQ